jgi:hypothetical protein
MNSAEPAKRIEIVKGDITLLKVIIVCFDAHMYQPYLELT